MQRFQALQRYFSAFLFHKGIVFLRKACELDSHIVWRHGIPFSLKYYEIAVIKSFSDYLLVLRYVRSSVNNRVRFKLVLVFYSGGFRFCFGSSFFLSFCDVNSKFFFCIFTKIFLGMHFKCWKRGELINTYYNFGICLPFRVL